MKNTHTTGEWKIKPSTVSPSEICIIPDLGQVVCDICPLADEKEMMANARLICKAPDMFSLIQQYLKADTELARAECHKRAWAIVDQINPEERENDEIEDKEEHDDRDTPQETHES